MTPESYMEEIESHEIIEKITQEAHQRAYEDFLMVSCWGISCEAAKKETHAVGFEFS